MANPVPTQNLMRGKRPLWVTALLVISAGLLWIAQQKGWIKSNAGPSGTATGPVASAPANNAPTRQPSSNNVEPAKNPSTATTSTTDEDANESDSSLTAAERASKPPASTNDIDDLYSKKRDGVWVEGSLKVKKLLSDDDDPPRHQRFLADTPDGHSVMVAHNIDLSDRVPLQAGDTIEVRGEYVWTEQGGKVHFTHKPQYGKFSGGWVKVRGKKYE